MKVFDSNTSRDQKKRHTLGSTAESQNKILRILTPSTETLREVAVEQPNDKLSRNRILAVGHAFAISELRLPIADSIEALPGDLESFLVLLNLNPEDQRAALDALSAKGLPPDQIILCLKEGAPPTFACDSLTGFLEVLDSDSIEERKRRFNARIETQKHRKLAAAIETARLKGIPSGLPADEWCARLDAAHLTHAFCLAIDLAPRIHGSSLKLALEHHAEKSQWPSSIPIEELLPLCARLALRHWQTPAKFREEFRDCSTKLPFRLRTDLRNAVERCLESMWKGLSHAA